MSLANFFINSAGFFLFLKPACVHSASAGLIAQAVSKEAYISSARHHLALFANSTALSYHANAKALSFCSSCPPLSNLNTILAEPELCALSILRVFALWFFSFSMQIKSYECRALFLWK